LHYKSIKSTKSLEENLKKHLLVVSIILVVSMLLAACQTAAPATQAPAADKPTAAAEVSIGVTIYKYCQG